MITLEEKQEIARENGKKSHGPITPEGKSRCAQNPIKHGLASKRVVLAHESQEAYDELLKSQRECWQPANDNEDLLVVKMVNAHWRLCRINAMETAFLDVFMMSNSEDYEAAYPTHHPALRAMDAFTDAALANPVSLQAFPRYEAHFDCQYYKAFNALMKLRRERNAPKLAVPADPPQQTAPEAPTPELSPTAANNNPLIAWLAAILTYLLNLLGQNQPAPAKLPTRPTSRTPRYTPKPLPNLFTSPETFSWWTDYITKAERGANAKREA